jgi:hypothetical protein
VVENVEAGRWPGGEEEWRAAALEHGGERGRRSVRRGEERRDGMVTLEHGAAVRTRRYGEWRGTDDGLMSEYGWRRVDKHIRK